MNKNTLDRLDALGINNEIERVRYKSTVNKMDSLLVKAKVYSDSLSSKIDHASGVKVQARNAGIISNEEIDKIEKSISLLKEKKDSIDKKIQEIIKSLNDADNEPF